MSSSPCVLFPYRAFWMGASVIRNLFRFIDGPVFYLVGFIAICVTDKRRHRGGAATARGDGEMRKWCAVLPAALALAPVAGRAADVPTVQIALAGAADLSAVYPTVTIPANEHDFAVIFTYPDQEKHQVDCNTHQVDAKGPFRIDPNGEQTAVAPIPDGSRFLIRQPFLTDLPVGSWIVEVKVDGKVLGTVPFNVVAPATTPQPPSPVAMVGSLSQGTEWTFQFRFLAEPRPGLKLTIDELHDADAQGWLNTTLRHRVVSLDPDGARREQRRGNGPALSSWLVPTDRGLAIAKVGSDDGTQPLEPPELMVLTPNGQFHRSWQWRAKDADPALTQRFEMWGPVPIKTPQGEQPGYIVLQQVPDPDDPTQIGTSVEYRYAPGLGLVHEVLVTPIPGADTATRSELDLTAMTHGSGPEPDIRPYQDSR